MTSPDCGWYDELACLDQDPWLGFFEQSWVEKQDVLRAALTALEILDPSPSTHHAGFRARAQRATGWL